MIEISIIIPAYNVQEYIATCLESIALQTFKNYEVIIINDGSKDDTQLICEQFTEKIQNINIISKSIVNATALRRSVTFLPFS